MKTTARTFTNKFSNKNTVSIDISEILGLCLPPSRYQEQTVTEAFLAYMQARSIFSKGLIGSANNLQKLRNKVFKSNETLRCLLKGFARAYPEFEYLVEDYLLCDTELRIFKLSVLDYLDVDY